MVSLAGGWARWFFVCVEWVFKIILWYPCRGENLSDIALLI